jgi:hypothetical protein
MNRTVKGSSSWDLDGYIYVLSLLRKIVKSGGGVSSHCH